MKKRVDVVGDLGAMYLQLELRELGLFKYRSLAL